MKWIAWALLALNLAVAGFFIGRGHWPQPASGQNAPMNVERLSLRSESAHPSSVPPPQQAARAEALCVEWRGLSGEERNQVREQLKALAHERAMSFTEVPLNTRYWVIFPPLPSAESAAAKLSELAAAGVPDAFVVRDGVWRNAISLGLYANDEAARRRAREVEARGVLGTRVELQARQGTEYYFVIRSEDPDALKSLGGIKQAYPDSQQSRVACPS
ncbi:MAG: hypothetical protein BGO62_08170 [Thiobacillus sp. 65-1402]|uniref:hypothetical protein n=1 Tax=uncultured Thiobacillus sp. TaxID=189996 RepID=UPI00095F50F1|nr:hypothetical protein [uncultured Thiobacillus sp.]OJW84229.1 MAG: hypothetical protein BGO62_08170 [Thiobacillus sp. 65-1402]